MQYLKHVGIKREVPSRAPLKIDGIAMDFEVSDYPCHADSMTSQ
jgi:hypothetical protein